MANFVNSDTKKEIFGTELTNEKEKPWEKKPENSLRNPNPNRGIFANIDFDRLNAKPKEPKTPIVITEPSTSRMSAKDFFGSEEKSEDFETFGPAKPKENSKFQRKNSTESSDSENEWVEKSDTKKKKHKKEKKKKSKSKKKKSKKSSKKKHKRKNSSESDSDSD